VKGLWLGLMTIRESILKGTLLFFFFFGNAIILLFAFAISSQTEGETFAVTFFGNPIPPPPAGTIGPVEFILYQLFQTSTQSAMFLGIFATAGLIPSMLEKGTVELYLSKPISRIEILLSRSLGACAGIGVNLLYFALGIWLVFGLKAGVWHGGFLLATLASTVVFTFYYSLVAFTALVSRSSGFAIMLAFIYSFFSGALEMREMSLFQLWDNVVYHRFLDAIYYCTPQLSAMMESSARLIAAFPIPPMMTEPGEFTAMPFLFSFLSACLFYGSAAWYFSRQDY